MLSGRGGCMELLLGIADVPGQRALERKKDELLRQKDVLLEEMVHIWQ